MPTSEQRADTEHASAQPQPRVFISYSRSDAVFARRLFGALEERGVNAWVDWEGIPPSAEWWREVTAAIEGAEAFVFVISPDSVGSPVCRDEVAHAVKNNKRLIPLVSRELDRGAQAGLAGNVTWAVVGRINWIFFRDADDFAAALAKLLDAIHTDLDWVRVHSRLLQRAIEWDSGKRDPSFLLQRNDLSAAEQWLVKGPERDPKPTTLQTEYILVSRATAVRRRRRLLTATAIAAVLIALASIVAGWQTITSEIRQAEASSRRLAAQVQGTFDSGAWDLGLLLGVLAYDTTPTVEATNALLSGLEHMRGIRGILPDRYAVEGPFSLSADGKLLAATPCAPSDAPPDCSGTELVLVDTQRMRAVAKFSSPQNLNHAAFDLAGKRMAISTGERSLGCSFESDSAAGVQSRIQFFDLPPTLAANVRPIAFAPSGRAIETGEITGLAFAGSDRLVALEREILSWRVADGVPGRKIALCADAIDRDATKALAVTSNAPAGAGVVTLWDLAEAPRRVASIKVGRGTLQQIAFNADGRMSALITCAIMASGRHCNGELRLLDLAARTARGPFVTNAQSDDPMLTVAFAQDDKWLVTGGCGKSDANEACLYGQLNFWSARDEGDESMGQPVRTYGGLVQRLAMARDGRTLASLSSGGRITVWNIDSAMVQAINVLPSVLQLQRTAVADAAPLKCGTEEVTHPVLRAAAATLKVPTDLCPALGGFTAELALAWDPGPRLLAVGGCIEADKSDRCKRGAVRTWSSVEGQLRKQAELPAASSVTSIAIGPAPRGLIAVGRCDGAGFRDCLDGAAIELFDPAGTTPMRVLATGLGRVSALSLNLRADTLAYATCIEFPESGPPTDRCAAGAIRLLDIPTAKVLEGTLSGHRGAVTTLAFNPAGSLLASGDADGSIGFWDVPSRQSLGPLLRTHYEPVEALRFVSESSLASETKSTMSEWRAAPQAWKETACRLAGRTLSQTEQRRWAGSSETVRNLCSSSTAAPGNAWSRWMRALVLRYEGRG